MRDKTHSDFIEKWAKFVKNNPPEVWKPQLNEFIDAQYAMHDNFIKKLLKTKDGRKKIIKRYNIKNMKGYLGLLKT